MEGLIPPHAERWGLVVTGGEPLLWQEHPTFERLIAWGRGRFKRVTIETNGTVLSPTGLTVTSLGSIDPRAAVSRSDGGETEFKEVKLRLADGTEVPARVVLKDADLDLAFIAPTAAADPRQFAHLRLENAADAVVLGTYYDLTRVNKALQRLPIVRLSTVVGVVEKPRRLVLVTDQSLGCPIFDARGRTLGITLRYYAIGRLSGVIVLPAADVADMAKQAEAARQAADANPVPAAAPDAVLTPAEPPPAPAK